MTHIYPASIKESLEFPLYYFSSHIPPHMCSMNQTNWDIINGLFSSFATCSMYLYPIGDFEHGAIPWYKLFPINPFFSNPAFLRTSIMGVLAYKYITINKNRRLWLKMCSEIRRRIRSPNSQSNCSNGHCICPIECLNISLHGQLSTYC